MNWKKQLRKLERAHTWDLAIIFMKKIIEQYPDDMDTYLFMNYLIANLFSGEHDWDIDNQKKWDEYTELLKKYLDESCEKFSDNAEFLFYTAQICGLLDWYFGDENKDYKAMFEKAIALEPDNLIYAQIYSTYLPGSVPLKEERYITLAKKVLAPNSQIKKIFDEMGALGEETWDNLEHTSKRVLGLPTFVYEWEK